MAPIAQGEEGAKGGRAGGMVNWECNLGRHNEARIWGNQKNSSNCRNNVAASKCKIQTNKKANLNCKKGLSLTVASIKHWLLLLGKEC